MPPPPMVPGKHNLDGNTWDLPNNNPPLVPSPPPPIDIAQTDINSDFAPNFALEQNSSENRSDKLDLADSFKDESKTNFNNANFGRIRHSPNGHSRKNWSTQHPLQQNRQPQIGTLRRGDGNTPNVQNRYGERRNYQSNNRQEQGSVTQDFKDENSPRSTDNLSVVAEVASESPQAVLDELRDKNNYNPIELDLKKAAKAR